MSQISSKPSPLGRGLSALFGDADASYQAPQRQVPAAQPAAQPQPALTNDQRSFRRVPVSVLEPGMYQPRRHFDEEALKGLSDSIRERGVLEPLIVRPLKGREAFEIIAGERRWRASQMAGLHEVPVIVRDLTDREALEFSLIENIQRADLGALEEAEGYKRLIDEFKYTQDHLAKIMGKSRAHVGNMMRILSLPEPVKRMIDKGELTAGHARAIINCPDPMAVAVQIASKGLNVRQTEQLVRDVNTPKPGAAPLAGKNNNVSRSADILALEKDLERHMGFKIRIQDQGGSGSVTIFYDDLDQMESILTRLKK